MARGSQDIYGEFGSVPNQQPLQGSGASPLSVRASPQDFGAQVGAGVERVGEAAEGLAKQYGDMVNETLMTKADTDFATKVGQIKADYQSKTGMAAFNAFPAYQSAVAQAFQDSRANLPLGAQHGFDMLGARTMANHIADGSTYATSQLKEAQRSAGSDLTNANIQAVLDPSVANDPNRVDEHTGHAIYGLQMQMDENHPGLKKNENGEVNFDESTSEGKGLKAQYETQRDDIITRIQSNRFDTLSKNDALGAYGMYLNERSDLPKQTQIALDAKFEPVVFNAHKDNAVGHAVAQSQDDYAKMLYNPQKTPLDIIRENEGYTGKIGRDSNGANVLNGINEKSFPAEYAEAKRLLDTQGKPAADAYADNFYQKNIIDKYDIKSLPAGTQSIVADAIVNQGEFGKSLIADAKNGASPQELIDKRRAEYQRLADSDTDGSKGYAVSLNGWNNRLDKLQTITTAPAKSYATNPDGSMFTQADYYRTHGEDVLAKGDAYAQATMPDDLAFKRAVRENLTNYMSKVQANQAGQYMMDNKNVMRAINGEFTKGKPPETEQELRAIPGMNDLLNKVSAQDPRFAEGIPTMIGKVARRNDVTNSANGYDTILRTLQPNDSGHPNKITHQSELDSLLGKSDGTGINMKDYNDAKAVLDVPELKEPLLKHMQEITNANGNVDGKGQQRAMQWYGQVMSAWKQNSSQGDKAMSASEFASKIGETDGPLYAPPAPSRMTQISNWAKEATGLGHILVTNPDGQQGYIPASNVEAALKAGYKRVE